LLNSPGCGIFSEPKSPPGLFVIGTTQVATDTIDYVATTWGNTSTSARNVIVEAATSTAQ